MASPEQWFGRPEEERLRGNPFYHRPSDRRSSELHTPLRGSLIREWSGPALHQQCSVHLNLRMSHTHANQTLITGPIRKRAIMVKRLTWFLVILSCLLLLPGCGGGGGGR